MIVFSVWNGLPQLQLLLWLVSNWCFIKTARLSHFRQSICHFYGTTSKNLL